MNKHYLVIDSVDRISGSPSNFSVHLPYTINGIKCELVSLQMPNTYYNITNKNNALTINGSLTYVTPGNYNLIELMNAIPSQIPDILSVSFNTTTNVLNLLTNSISLAFPTSNSISKVLGFENSYSSTGTSHNSVYPPSLYDLETYIEIPEFSSNFMTTNTNNATPTFVVPNNANKGDVITFNQNTQFNQRALISGFSLQTITIRVKNQFNDIVQKLGDWTMMLNLS